LKKHDAELQRVTRLIKTQYDDQVIYKGQLYTTKMTHDYSNIQYRAAEELKRRRQSLPPVNMTDRIMSAGPVNDGSQQHRPKPAPKSTIHVWAMQKRK
jgi:hypothetical protein